LIQSVMTFVPYSMVEIAFLPIAAWKSVAQRMMAVNAGVKTHQRPE
jgi:hypothetical protein